MCLNRGIAPVIYRLKKISEGMPLNIKNVVKRFVAAINQQDVNSIFELMTENHRFIDSGGWIVEGNEAMKRSWIGYFNMVPDYFITITEILVLENTAVLLGKASGTYNSGGRLKPGIYREIPAAWRAVVTGDRILEWRIYADIEPIIGVMRTKTSEIENMNHG